MKFIIIIISMVLVNNYPLAQFLGICPFLGVSKDLDSSTGMGIAVRDRISADSSIHPCYRGTGSAGRDVHEEEHARAL